MLTLGEGCTSVSWVSSWSTAWGHFAFLLEAAVLRGFGAGLHHCLSTNLSAGKTRGRNAWFLTHRWKGIAIYWFQNIRTGQKERKGELRVLNLGSILWFWELDYPLVSAEFSITQFLTFSFKENYYPFSFCEGEIVGHSSQGIGLYQCLSSVNWLLRMPGFICLTGEGDKAFQTNQPLQFFFLKKIYNALNACFSGENRIPIQLEQ